MKAVLISVKPKYCELIASEKKTVEVRKTRPKLETPFKCYIYSSKDKWEHLVQNPDKTYEIYNGKDYGKYDKSLKFKNERNGKVIGEFMCDKIDEFHEFELEPRGDYEEQILKDFLKNTCLSYEEVQSYRANLPFFKPIYGWHISDLKIYDKPKELSEFRHCGENYHFNPIVTRPPQSWCYVENLK